jgi:hypothetical protein
MSKDAQGTLSEHVAEWTGLEPATPGVTGRYSNQLNYHSALFFPKVRPFEDRTFCGMIRTAVLVGAEGFEPPTLAL